MTFWCFENAPAELHGGLLYMTQKRLVGAVGIEPLPLVESPQVIHFTKRQNRQILPKRQSEVHGGYAGASALSRTRSDVRVTIYARVSTSSGQQSQEMQLREIREYCQRRGWEVANEYVDVGISGVT